MALIRSLTGLQSGRVRQLKTGSLVIGRNPRCCDLVLDHFAVSREHARITVADGAAYLEDLDSRNGVLINGLPVPTGLTGRQRLYSGDRIRIATFEFIYEEDPSSGVHLSEQAGGNAEVLSTVHMGDDPSKPDVSRGIQEKQRTILRIVGGLPSAADPERVLPQILDRLFGSFPQATGGAIFLFEESSGNFLPAAVRRRDGGDLPISVDRSVLRDVVAKRSALLTTESYPSEPQQAGETSTASYERSLLIVPLIDVDRVLGLIQLEAARGIGSFSEGDLDVLASVAGHLAHVIHNSRLHDAALRAQRSELEQRFQGLIEGSIQGILVHRQFQPLFVNEAYARLFGYTVAEILNLQSIMPLMAADDQERVMVSAAEPPSHCHLPARYETRGVRRDGSEVWLEKFVSVVDWVDGPAFQAAVIDVSDRKAAEDALRSAHAHLEEHVQQRTKELAEANRRLEWEIAERKQKEEEFERSNRDLEQFAYSVSHDLRSPLRTIVNYCQLVRNEAAARLSAQESEFLDHAVEDARRMMRLLDDLLAYSRVSTQAESRRPTDVDAVLGEAIRNLRAEIFDRGAAVSRDPLPTVVCDATQLMVLFQNLIHNAITYRGPEPPSVHISAEERETDWLFNVRDNGEGIAPEHFERVFHVFQRLHTEDEIAGSGVGLAICKRIVERHGGAIWVESSPRRGSVFHFTIPKSQLG